MRIKITSTVFLLVAVLLLVSPAFSQETGMDPIDNNELDDEEQEQVEPVSDEEIDHFAGIELTVRRGQRELEEEITEIRQGSGLTATELRQLQRTVDAAGGDLDDVDESLLEDGRYRDVITGLADVRERSRNIVAEAVAQSRMDESRFNELVIIISHDRQLTQRVNRIVSAELEEERARREAERETNADGNDEPEDAEDTEDADDESDS